MNLYESFKKNLKEGIESDWKRADSAYSEVIMDGYISMIEDTDNLDDLRRLVRKIFEDERIDDIDYDWLMDNTILEKYKALGFKFPEDESTYEIITHDVDAFHAGLHESQKSSKRIPKKLKEAAGPDIPAYYGDPNDDPDWHRASEKRDDPEPEVIYFKDKKRKPPKGDVVTSQDLNGNVVLKAELDGKTYYIECFWSSNDAFDTEEEAAEWEDPDDVWGMAFTVYNDKGEEVDGGMKLDYDYGAWSPMELASDMMGLCGFTKDPDKVTYLKDVDDMSDIFEDFYEAEKKPKKRAANKPYILSSEEYDVVDKVMMNSGMEDSFMLGSYGADGWDQDAKGDAWWDFDEGKRIPLAEGFSWFFEGFTSPEDYDLTKSEIKTLNELAKKFGYPGNGWEV